MSQSPYLDQIKIILLSVFRDVPCVIYLFGSRATGTPSPVSDFDIAILAERDISRELSAAREKLEMSTIPFKVDLVDLRSASPALARHVMTEGILVWKS